MDASPSPANQTSDGVAEVEPPVADGKSSHSQAPFQEEEEEGSVLTAATRISTEGGVSGTSETEAAAGVESAAVSGDVVALPVEAGVEPGVVAAESGEAAAEPVDDAAQLGEAAAEPAEPRGKSEQSLLAQRSSSSCSGGEADPEVLGEGTVSSSSAEDEAASAAVVAGDCALAGDDHTGEQKADEELAAAEAVHEVDEQNRPAREVGAQVQEPSTSPPVKDKPDEQQEVTDDHDEQERPQEGIHAAPVDEAVVGGATSPPIPVDADDGDLIPEEENITFTPMEDGSCFRLSTHDPATGTVVYSPDGTLPKSSSSGQLMSPQVEMEVEEGAAAARSDISEKAAATEVTSSTTAATTTVPAALKKGTAVTTITGGEPLSTLEQAMSPHLQKGPISAAELNKRITELRRHHTSQRLSTTVSAKLAKAAGGVAEGVAPEDEEESSRSPARGRDQGRDAKKQEATASDDCSPVAVGGPHDSVDDFLAGASTAGNSSKEGTDASTSTSSSDAGAVISEARSSTGVKSSLLLDADEENQNQNTGLGSSSSSSAAVPAATAPAHDHEHEAASSASSDSALLPVRRITSTLPPGNNLPLINSREFQDLMDQNLILVDWDREEGMGVKTAIYTLTGSIVGAGAVACPFAFQFMGLFAGVFFLALMGFLSGYSGYLLGMAARKTGLHSYEEIAVTTMGRKMGKSLALASVIGVTFCAAIAYCNLWADTLLPILDFLAEDVFDFHNIGAGSFIVSPRTCVIVVCIASIAPLCLKRQMSGVATASLLSIVAMAVLMLVIVLYAMKNALMSDTEWAREGDKFEWLGPNPFTDFRNHPCHGIFSTTSSHWSDRKTFVNDVSGLLMGIPYFCSAFLCHFNVFSVFAEMRKPTKIRLKKVMRRTMLISGSLYLVIAACGFYVGQSYEKFVYSVSRGGRGGAGGGQRSESSLTSAMVAAVGGEDLGGEELMQDDEPRVRSATCEIGVQGNILQNFPHDAFFVNLGRFCLFIALYFTYPLLIHPCRATVHRAIFGDLHKASTFQHSVETLSIMLLAFTTAILVPQVQIVLGYAGSTFGILLAFVFPAFFVLRLSVARDRSNLIALVIFVFGCGLCVATTAIQMVHEETMKLGKNVELEEGLVGKNLGLHSTEVARTPWYSAYIAVDVDTGRAYVRKDDFSKACTFVTKEELSMREKVSRYVGLRKKFVDGGGVRPVMPQEAKSAAWAEQHGCCVNRDLEQVQKREEDLLSQQFFQ